MNERCPVCALKFEREPGYFLGAMYIGYGLALVAIALLTVAVWLAFRLSFQGSVIWAAILFVPFAPLLTVMSRVLWIYFDQAVDPDER